MDFEKEREYLFNMQLIELEALYNENPSDFNLFLKELSLYLGDELNQLLEYFNVERNLSDLEEAFIKDMIVFYNIPLSISDKTENIDLNKVIPFVEIKEKEAIYKKGFKKEIGWGLLGIGGLYLIYAMIASFFNKIDILNVKVGIDTIRIAIALLLITLGSNAVIFKKNILPLGALVILVLTCLITYLININGYKAIEGSIFFEHIKNTILAIYNVSVYNTYKSWWVYYG